MSAASRSAIPVRIASDITTSIPKPQAISTPRERACRCRLSGLIHGLVEVQELIERAEGQKQQHQQAAHQQDDDGR